MYNYDYIEAQNDYLDYCYTWDAILYEDENDQFYDENGLERI